MNLHNGLQSVLNDCSAPSGSSGRNTYAERERLCRPFSEILGTCQREVTFIEHVFFALVFLEPLVVGKRNPDQFVPAFNNARFDLDPLGLNILFAFNVHFASDRFSFLIGCLVECYPDLTLRMREVTQ